MDIASTVHQEVEKNSRKIFQSLISPRIIATAQIGFLLLKALYLSFQMDTSQAGNWRHFWGGSATPAARAPLRRAFQMTLELFAEASLKKLLYAVSMVANCVTRE